MEYYKECRQHFNTEEWINLIISSMGFNPTLYNADQNNVLITRILPMVEPRINIIELAPKGAGKAGVKAPQKAYDVADEVLSKNGAAPQGYKGGRTFANDGRDGGQVLPKGNIRNMMSIHMLRVKIEVLSE
jgi:hypothetical protein